MKIFGLHWIGHLGYLFALLGGFYLGKQQLEQVNFIKSQVGEVQQLTLPKVKSSNEYQFSNINRNAMAFNTAKNEKDQLVARHAMNLVNNFSQKCDLAQQDKNGTIPISSIRSLVSDYFSLGDSLTMILPQNAIVQKWLDWSLFDDYRTYSPRQFAIWLAIEDTSNIYLLIQNLRLKTFLALSVGLTEIWKQRETSNSKFDALLPVINYVNCPKVGQPFEANIYLASYASLAEKTRVTVNGQLVPIVRGLAHYQTPSKPTELTVNILVENPLTGEKKDFVKDFIVRN